MENVRIPPLVSIRRALEIYCDRDSLGNAEIKELFGCCDATAITLKRLARAVREKEGVMPRTSSCVCTDCAFRAWGMDVEAMERKVRRAERLKLNTKEAGV